MDPWVNSLVQSPLVRSLNTVPSRMSSFAHGVKDNVPPFSRNRVVIDPPQNSVVERYDMGSTTVTNTTPVTSNTSVRYDIPMYGLLDQAYILVRVIGQTSASNLDYYPINQPRPEGNPDAIDMYLSGTAGSTGNSAERGKLIEQMLSQPARSTSLNFADVIDSVELRGNTKPIETLYAASIASEVQKMPVSHREFYYNSLTGYAAGTSKWSHHWDPLAGTYVTRNVCASDGSNEAILRLQFNEHEKVHSLPFVDFLIPLPFSTLHQLKDNYQTRFVEPLHINVNLKPMPHVHSSINTLDATKSTGYRMSLVCNFHNFHDVIENSVRDQNYKRGFPASVYGYNFNRSYSKLGAATTDTVSLALTGKELIDECIVMIKRKQPVAGITAYNAMSYSVPVVTDTLNQVTALVTKAPVPLANQQIPSFFFRLTGSGREIWSGWDFELHGPAGHDFELADGHRYGEDLTIPHVTADEAVHRGRSSHTNGLEYTISGGNLQNITHKDMYFTGSVRKGFSHAMFPIKFGIQSNQNFYTGGLALQTISNPTLQITAYSNGALVTSDFWSKYDAELVLRHSQMIRIDSDTGIITTTLTS